MRSSAKLDAGGGKTRNRRQRPANSLAAKFDRLGVSTLEEYAEFVPPEAKPNAITGCSPTRSRSSMRARPTLVGGSKARS